MRRVWVVTAGVLVAGIVADIVVGEDLPGFMAVFSFTGCVVIIIASKWLGKLFVQRREDHFGEAGDA